MSLTEEGKLDIPELVPARMLNEFVYCPRLAYLEWVQGEFEDSADTVEGRSAHKRVDGPEPTAPLEEPEDREGVDEPAPLLHARSVWLSSEKLKITARIDLVEAEGLAATPIDYKKGRKPDIPEGAWEPDRVQVCAQALLLREHGYEVEHGIVYYCRSKQHVEVPLSDELIARTLEVRNLLEETARRGTIPEPLNDSPRCIGCSLAGICLPDEVTFLKRGTDELDIEDSDGIRRLIAPRQDGIPLYVQEQGARISKKGDELVVSKFDAELARVRIVHTSHVALMGNVQASTQVLRELVAEGIPVCYFTYGGWFWGVLNGMHHKNIELRIAQYGAALDAQRSLGLARHFVVGKIRNSRTMLKRNNPEAPDDVLERLDILAKQVDNAGQTDSLLGIEGTAARLYFENLAGMLKPKGEADLPAFEFSGRNRRPPKDPVNALLSLAYSLLAKDCFIAVTRAGFDPLLGFYHRPRYGRPALALDLMETFRPIIADSAVITAVNTGVVTAADFRRTLAGVMLLDAGRKNFIKAYERRMDTLISHPVFGYKANYRRVLDIEARLLGRHLLGEMRLDQLQPFVTR